MIAAYMKLACSTVFACSIDSESFKNSNFSSFKEFGQVGETAEEMTY